MFCEIIFVLKPASSFFSFFLDNIIFSSARRAGEEEQSKGGLTGRWNTTIPFWQENQMTARPIRMIMTEYSLAPLTHTQLLEIIRMNVSS